uniref:Uncharacterized protein n=1 Tax=Kalanchoe fedtschenkoi TaxID=63787 RepID=A0A7N0UHJ5_KALFE
MACLGQKIDVDGFISPYMTLSTSGDVILKGALDRSNSLKKFYAPREKPPTPPTANSVPSKVVELCRLFDSQKISSKLKLSGSARAPKSAQLPGGEDEVVVYFTSLRGMQRTYEDCYTVRMIFRGLRVYVDERYVSIEQSQSNRCLKQRLE